jgi:RNA polymerase sigma-70 factor (ECF subfamily)
MASDSPSNRNASNTSDAPDPVAIVRRLEAATDAAEVAAAAAELDALFAAHHERLVAACQRMVGDPERARELAQEAMLVAYSKLGEFRGDAAFYTWLYGIARNLCFRAVAKKRDLLADDGVLEAEDPHTGVVASLRRAEREALVRAAAETLTPLEQEAVYLRYVEQLPQERITEILGLDASSGARGLLQRCRRKLGRELSRLLGEMGHGTSFIRTTS